MFGVGVRVRVGVGVRVRLLCMLSILCTEAGSSVSESSEEQ